MQPCESQKPTQWSLFSNEEGTGPLALGLLMGLLMESVTYRFPRSKNNNCLCISSSACLWSTQTTQALFLLHLSTTSLLASFSPIRPPPTCSLPVMPGSDEDPGVIHRVVWILGFFFRRISSECCWKLH